MVETLADADLSVPMSKLKNGYPAMTQRFADDFASLSVGIAEGYQGPPYAFVRFADGEAAIMQGRTHKAKSDRWQAAEVNPKWKQGLIDAIEYDDGGPGYFVGISAEGHHGQVHYELLERTRVPLDQVTFAELFIFANYTAVNGWDLKQFDVVHQNSYKLNIPKDAVLREWDHRPLVDALVEGDKGERKPVLVSGGPAAKLVILDYWKASESPRVILDVGSAIDEKTRRRRTRAYQNPKHERRAFVPVWEHSVGEVTKAASPFSGSGGLQAPRAGGGNQ